MFGQGLLKGLQITWGRMFSEKQTVEYPDEQLEMFPRYHGRFVLDVDKCIACSLCAKACPNEVISLQKQKVGKKQFLTDYVMNIQYCLFCGLCVESCNKDALYFSQVIDMNQYFHRDIPLVLVRREAPTEPVEEEKPVAKAGEDEKAKPEPKQKVEAKSDKPAEPAADSEVVVGKASVKEGQ